MTTARHTAPAQLRRRNQIRQEARFSHGKASAGGEWGARPLRLLGPRGNRAARPLLRGWGGPPAMPRRPPSDTRPAAPPTRPPHPPQRLPCRAPCAASPPAVPLPSMSCALPNRHGWTQCGWDNCDKGISVISHLILCVLFF